jgi:hypothetical protein
MLRKAQSRQGFTRTLRNICANYARNDREKAALGLVRARLDCKSSRATHRVRLQATLLQANSVVARAAV